MPIRPLAVALLALLQMSHYANAAAPDSPLGSSIEAAIADADLPFRLEVDCTDAKSSRSLRIYRGRVAAWNRQWQLTLGRDDRAILLGMLQDARFADFEARYGGRAMAEKEEAALRVSCRIDLRMQGASKTSIQLADGEQSDELLGLAARLLDHVERLAKDGVTAGSLQDAIGKLADGSLAPELLELRLLSLPGTGHDAGHILRVDGGSVSRQRYRPGRLVEEPETRELAECDAASIIEALNEARFWALPRSLQYAVLTELEVGVLGHRRTLIARSSFRAGGDAAQAALAALLSRLELLPSDCAGG